MDQAEILKKALDKAIKNGWEFMGYKNWDEYLVASHFEGQAKDQITTVALWWTKKVHHMEKIRWEVIVYRHDFAKAFWNEEKCQTCIKEKVPIKRNCRLNTWKTHLKEMVVEEEPIKYLGKFLS